MTAPTRLRVEHLDDPLGITMRRPRLSWQLPRGCTAHAMDQTGVAHESLNHYNKGAVIDFMHRYVAGVQSLDDGPGYSRFRVAPQPGGGLAWAEATHDSPYGRIEVGWHRSNDVYRLRVSSPPSTSAEVILPDGRRVDVKPGVALFEFATGEA